MLNSKTKLQEFAKGSGKMIKFSIPVMVMTSALISFFIVLHSWSFISQVMDPTMALLLAVVIEFCFVTYSIFGVISGRWTVIDKSIKAMIFFLSVIPATMDISLRAKNKFSENISIQQPVKPVELKNVGDNLRLRINSLDDEIKALRSFKNSYSENQESRAWYAFQDQKRIDRLISERAEISDRLSELENTDAENQRKYQEELKAFRESNSKAGIDIYFDLAFLAWTILIIWVLQFLNGRMSRNVALLIQSGGEDNLSDITDLNQPIIDKDVYASLLKLKPKGLSKSILRSFLLKNFLFNHDDLLLFNNQDASLNNNNTSFSVRDLNLIMSTIESYAKNYSIPVEDSSHREVNSTVSLTKPLEANL